MHWEDFLADLKLIRSTPDDAELMTRMQWSDIAYWTCGNTLNRSIAVKSLCYGGALYVIENVPQSRFNGGQSHQYQR